MPSLIGQRTRPLLWGLAAIILISLVIILTPQPRKSIQTAASLPDPNDYADAGMLPSQARSVAITLDRPVRLTARQLLYRTCHVLPAGSCGCEARHGELLPPKSRIIPSDDVSKLARM